MLLRRVWPSRPAFENPFAEFDQLRREMLRVFDTVAGNDGISNAMPYFAAMMLASTPKSMSTTADNIPGAWGPGWFV